MASYEKRMEYYQLMCDKLNEAGIKEYFGRREGVPQYNDWKVSEDSEQYFFSGGICGNYKAFQFLKNEGIFDMGICPECGEHPIGKSYLFTSGLNSNIQYYICASCYNRGKKYSTNPKSDKSGCYIASVCYGSPESKEVVKFKNYRDEVLLKSFHGRIFVKIYYLISPQVAFWLTGKSRINHWLKVNLFDKIYKRL